MDDEQQERAQETKQNELADLAREHRERTSQVPTEAQPPSGLQTEQPDQAIPTTPQAPQAEPEPTSKKTAKSLSKRAKSRKK